MEILKGGTKGEEALQEGGGGTRVSRRGAKPPLATLLPKCNTGITCMKT